MLTYYAGYPQEGSGPLSANHRDVCKYSSQDNPNYISVRDVLANEIHEITSSPIHRNRISSNPEVAVSKDAGTSESPVCFIPLFPNSNFVGRDATLRAIRERFFTQNYHTLALFGLGGIGKTQVALCFAYWLKENSPEYSIYWLPVVSEETYERACLEIVKELNLERPSEVEGPKETLKRFLSSEKSGKFLLIVDNADDRDLMLGNQEQPKGLNTCLPVNRNGLILFTTRFKNLSVELAETRIELHKMEETEATSYLERLLEKDMLEDGEVVTELLAKLEYLPLAITQAVAYIVTTSISIKEYLSRIQNSEKDLINLMAREFYDRTRYHDSYNAVATTWLVSFESIQQKSTVAADILMFISLIEPKEIPLAILPGGPNDLADGLESASPALCETIGLLCSYGFLTRRNFSNKYDMHSLVHLAARVWAQNKNFANFAGLYALRRLYECFPNWNYSNEEKRRLFMPHALAAIRRLPGHSPDEKYVLIARVGSCLVREGRLNDAFQLAEEVQNWIDGQIPDPSKNFLETYVLFAQILFSNGKTERAIEILERSTKDYNELAEGDSNLLFAKHLLARSYAANGQLQEAMTLLEYVVTIKKKTLPENHVNQLYSQHELASMYRINGRIEEARVLFEHVVAIRKKTQSENHPDLLGSQQELAAVYVKEERTEEAVALLEYIVEKHTVLAEEHPERLASQHALASAYLVCKQTQKAEKLLEHVVDVEKKTYAEDYPNLLTSQHQLAIAYGMSGQTSKAVELLTHVTQVKSRIYRADHPSRLISEESLQDYLKRMELSER